MKMEKQAMHMDIIIFVINLYIDLTILEDNILRDHVLKNHKKYYKDGELDVYAHCKTYNHIDIFSITNHTFYHKNYTFSF